jgi:hypothetical protein
VQSAFSAARGPRCLAQRMTRGVSLLLVSLYALLLGLCSGAQLRSELRSELLNNNPKCGSYPGPTDQGDYPDHWFKVLVCSGDSNKVILQRGDVDLFYWVVNPTREISYITLSGGMCYRYKIFSVQGGATCPDCQGSWVQRDIASKTVESGTCA